MKRESGFYWVRDEHNGWYIAGSIAIWYDDDFDEIDETQIVRT